MNKQKDPVAILRSRLGVPEWPGHKFTQEDYNREMLKFITGRRKYQ